jgi:hypothetical protein
MAARKGGYEWDVFISYPRRGAVLRWVKDVLHPELEDQLEVVGLGRAVRIFRDEADIEAGDKWPARLSEVHGRSRVIVAVLGFPYFESRWCCSEWRAATERHGDGGATCIIPLRFNDLEPETIASLSPKWRKEVAKVQVRDLWKYTTLVNRAADTELAAQFRAEIAELSVKVLKPAISGAPKWSGAWPKMPTDPFIKTAPAFKARLGRG